jgi:hypothetical protein
MLKRWPPAPPAPATAQARQQKQTIRTASFTESRLDGSALYYVDCWMTYTRPHPSPCEPKPDLTRHPLILDGLAVTFYLVFKEPAVFSGLFAYAIHPNPPCSSLANRPVGCF